MWYHYFENVFWIAATKIAECETSDYNSAAANTICIKPLISEDRRPRCYILCLQMPFVVKFPSVVCLLPLTTFSWFCDWLKMYSFFVMWISHSQSLYVRQTGFTWPRPHFLDQLSRLKLYTIKSVSQIL